jgi:enoyl-CoA hydratase/carnithine racemase
MTNDLERIRPMNHFVQCKEGPVTVLKLNRPPVNALDRAALEELSNAIEGVRSDHESRVLVLTGGIEGIFCSGGDLKYWRHVQDEREVSREGRKVFAQIERLPKPTIAAINGHVIGDGLALALVCDLRIAAETATFRIPEAAYGFIPGWGFIKRLVASVGRGNASGLLLTGQPIGAPRAQIMGLVNEIVPSDTLMDYVMDLSRQLAALSPASLRALKCALLGGNESACFDAVWGKDHWREGIDALLGKRPPVFLSDNVAGTCCDLGSEVMQHNTP